MKVLFIMPRMAVGGVEVVWIKLLRHFVAEGVACRLVVRKGGGELLDTASAVVPVDVLGATRNVLFLGALISIFRREQPTHVITAFSHYGIYVWLALRLSGCRAKWVHSVHNSHRATAAGRSIVRRCDHWLRNRMAGFAYRHAAVVVTVSDGLRSEVLAFRGVKPERVVTIYNPIVPAAELRLRPIDSTCGKRPVRLVAVGRLVRQKAFVDLIEAMAKVPGDWALDIWGEGPERHVLEGLILANGLQGRVVLRGLTSAPYQVMREADIFVLSSIHEGLSNVLIEAMACQCQLVATDCPHGPREILAGGEFGQLVPPADPTQLARAISRTINGQGLIDTAALLERARDFSEQTGCSRWLMLLVSLTHGENS